MPEDGLSDLGRVHATVFGHADGMTIAAVTEITKNGKEDTSIWRTHPLNPKPLNPR